MKKTARGGFSILFRTVGLLLKTVAVLILILLTTGVMFSVIFVIYMKTNLDTGNLDVTLDELTLNETSIIYYFDDTQNQWVESASIQSSEGNRFWVPYEEIPKDMEHALVAIEDKRFYTHHGVDWLRTASAFIHMFAGMENTFGGSTITQQLRKNLTGENEGTVRRKLTEIFAAMELENRYEKWQIIECYLNVVNFGHGQSDGIGDAARYYFDKEVKDLTLAEICCIIGITNNPSMYNPYFHPVANKERQETILFEMYNQGYIDWDTYQEAVNEPINLAYTSSSGSDNEVYSWFDEAVRNDVIEFFMEERGLSREMAAKLLSTGGFKIYSTMNPRIQEAVDNIYEDLDAIPKATGSSQQFQSAIVISDPYTGNVVAMAGSVGEKTGNLLYNMATDAKRPPGSTIKPIASYAPAMDMGVLTPDTLYEDSEFVKLNGTDWMPHNDDYEYNGIVDVREAIRLSLNVVAAQVVDQISPSASYNFLTNKLHMELDEMDESYAPMALGQLTYGITVREMSNAYCIFPNGGMYIESRTFTEIYDNDGKLLYENVPDTEAVISETTAYWMTDLLQTAVTSGTGSRARLDNMPVAGKTGTSTNYYDRWFVGFTPHYVAAVWSGYPYPARIHYNGNPASELWKMVMEQVHEGMEYTRFRKPDSTYQTPVPGVTPVSYYIRGEYQDFLGFTHVLYEEECDEKQRSVAGREIEVEAKIVDGYSIVGSGTAKITLSEESLDNVVVFKYVSNTPIFPFLPGQDDPDPTNPTNPDTQTPPETPQDTPGEGQQPQDAPGGEQTPEGGGNSSTPEGGGNPGAPEGNNSGSPPEGDSPPGILT